MGRFRVLLIGGSLVFAVAMAACTSGSTGLADLAIPEVGEVEAGFLDDGHPVFVIHDMDGSVHVVEAISTHIKEDTMAWCPTSRTIEDVFHGAIWDPWGRYVAGPGASDLGTYEFEVIEGRSELTVTAYVEPAPRSIVSSGVEGPRCAAIAEYEVHPFFEESKEE